MTIASSEKRFEQVISKGTTLCANLQLVVPIEDNLKNDDDEEDLEEVV